MSNHHTPIINDTVSCDQLIGNAKDGRMAFVRLVMHPAGGGTVDITVQNSHNPRLNLTKTLPFIAAHTYTPYIRESPLVTCYIQ